MFIHFPCEIYNNRNIILSSRMADNPNQTQEQNTTNEEGKYIESDVNSSGNYIKILLVYFIYQCPASTLIILQ